MFTRDDVTELNRADDSTQNLFLGDQELGVFTPDALTEPTAAQRRLDALHLVEDGYIGHFSIKVEQGGSVCSFALVRISKHDGLTHTRDTDYYGSVRISTSTSYGNWSTHTGAQGALNNGAIDDGAAVYTFAPGDNGSVVLRLSYDQAASIKVTATNGIAKVLASENPNFVFGEEFTDITWKDLFNTVSFSRNDGTRNWAGDWIEVDGSSATADDGPAVGNIRVINNAGDLDGHQKLRLRSNSYAVNNSIQPSLARTFNLAAVPASEDVVLSFDYNFTGVAPTDEIVVQARGTADNNTGWTALASYTSGNASGSGSASLNVTTALGGNANLTSTSQIRFRVANGLVGGRFYVDNVMVATATDECGFGGGAGALDHYAISHSGFGISCVGTPVTITAHDIANSPIDANGEAINISISPAKGVWARILDGNGVLTPLASQADNGSATYTFPAGEQAVTLLLNYTVPAGSTAPVNINVAGQTSTAVELEDPTLEIAEAGLVFHNETQDNYTIATQIAGKPSNVAPLGQLLTIQGVRSSDQNPMQCVPLFDVGQTLPIEVAAECTDADECVAGESFSINGEAIALVDNNDVAGATAYTEIELDFIEQPSGDIGATIVLDYSDVGIMQLHSRYNIPFGFFGDTNPITSNPIVPSDPLSPPRLSGDYMLGSSNPFVVRPFGFAIDFPGDDELDRAENQPDDNFPDRAGNTANSFAADANGTVFVYAGEGFDTVVTAMGWQAGDDANQDGQPDDGANLYDNRPTPNFFYDSDGQADNYQVKLTVLENQAEALGGVRGELSGDTLTFNSFDNLAVAATGNTSLSYNEVGIIDIQAQLVDNNDDPLTYLGTDVIRGVVNDVGRFYPRRFDVLSTMLLPRIDASCTPPSIFTYMDEAFAVELELVARNIQGATTVNYRGGFAKLAAYSDLNFRAIEEVASADNNDLSARLDNVSVPVNYQSTWSSIQGGELVLEGNLAFSRADPAEPDGPFEDLKIAFVPIDSDGVTLDPADLDTEITQATPEYYLIAEHDFRYGRLIVNNAFGPETEDLAITFRVEYYDGERFVVNTDDSCTVIDAAQLTLVPGTYTGNLDDGETEITTPQTTTFFEGQVQSLQSASNPSDATFTATAAGVGNGGTVDIELDLDALDLPFLQFRWPELDTDYNENPRAQLEFGQFRSHDRVIHWQEIYNGPSSP
jgi:MSHA biogenesis protein MshQ